MRSRRSAHRLEIAYIADQMQNLIDFLDARDALVRDVTAGESEGVDVTEWDHLVAI